MTLRVSFFEKLGGVPSDHVNSRPHNPRALLKPDIKGAPEGRQHTCRQSCEMAKLHLADLQKADDRDTGCFVFGEKSSIYNLLEEEIKER